MGKIFGISDLPVTIFTTPLQQIQIPEPKVSDLAKLQERQDLFNNIGKDIFISEKYANMSKQTVRKILK